MRKIFISAGHSNRRGRDRGAAGCGYVEGELTAELRSLIVQRLVNLGADVVVDQDDSIFSQTINFFRNLVTPDCIVLDIHFNAASPSASGTETLVPSNASGFECQLAYDLSRAVSDALGTPVRGSFRGLPGVKSEVESHHGRLGWMRLNGNTVLMEVCFITNCDEMLLYQKSKGRLASDIAWVLFKAAGGVQEPEQYHVVGVGDTLWGLSFRYRTSVTELKRLNGLSGSTISVGQSLRVK
jgi:N-acetylmuramoyl-L-alanine amidase